MDRLGFPYQVGNQCESCPNSCEAATNRKYRKKKRYIGKRSIPEETVGTVNETSPDNSHFLTKQVYVLAKYGMESD